jgi:hypothetical protein
MDAHAHALPFFDLHVSDDTPRVTLRSLRHTVESDSRELASWHAARKMSVQLMYCPRLHSLAAVALAGLTLAACGGSVAPQLKVLGVEKHKDAAVVLLEVVNHAQRPMQLERLQYSFGPATAPESVDLDRTVEAGSSVIVQVPIDLGKTAIPPGQSVTLDGQLYAHENAMERTFPVRASVTAPAPDQ